MKKLLNYIIPLLALLSILAACQSETQKFVPDEDSLLRVSFEYYNGWRVHDWGQEENAGLYTVFPIKPSFQIIVNRLLSIKIEELIWIATYRSNQVEEDMNHLAGIFIEPQEGRIIISDTPISLGGLAGREIITTIKEKPWNVIFINVLLKDEDRYYQFELRVFEIHRGGKYERQFEKILETISPVD